MEAQIPSERQPSRYLNRGVQVQKAPRVMSHPGLLVFSNWTAMCLRADKYTTSAPLLRSNHSSLSFFLKKKP